MMMSLRFRKSYCSNFDELTRVSVCRLFVRLSVMSVRASVLWVDEA